MNILTHPVHTGYQYDLARTGHQFYSLDIPGSGEVFWDFNSRPQPENYHRIPYSDEPTVKFDLALVHFEMGYECLKRTDLPMIWKEHCILRPFAAPAEWCERVSRFSFASHAAAEAWRMPPELAARKCVIGMGMDVDIYKGYAGSKPHVLVVGQKICSRGNEKGLDNLIRLAARFPISVVGRGNDGIPGAIGFAKDRDELVRHYQEHQIFLNPSNTLGMSTLEAMATGMPVVCFRMINSNVVRDGFNGLVVDNVKQAERALERLLKDRELRLKLGRNARATIGRKFRMEAFIRRWNELFQQVVDEHRSGNTLKNWKAFVFGSRSIEERNLASEIIAQTFEYHRVGFDKRTMTFMRNGRIGVGAERCELFWDLKIEEGARFLEIYSWRSLTCRLRQEPEGNWRGRWCDFEKMPIVVAPLKVGNPRSKVVTHIERPFPSK